MGERDEGLDSSDAEPATRWRVRRRLSRVITPIRFFSSAADAPRARRPTDAMLLLVSLVGLASAIALNPDPADSGSITAEFIRSLPGLFGWLWEIAHALMLAWAAFVVGAALVSRGRSALVRDQWLAITVALLACFLVASDWQTILDGLRASGPPAVFPGTRVALVTAALVTTSPHLGRPARRAGRVLLAIGTLASVALGAVDAIGAIAGLSVGAGAAALVHLLTGSPGGHPTPDQVAEALADLGFHTKRVEQATLQARGVGVMRAVTASGRTLFVKVYGRDAWDGQLLSSLWSFLWYRD